MKAIAAGDPLVVEQLDLKRQVDDLQIKQRSWTRRASRLAQGLPGWQTRIAALTPQLEHLKQLRHDAPPIRSWPITCFGHTVDTQAEADDQLRQRWLRLSYDPDQPTTIGTVGPWPVTAFTTHHRLAGRSHYECELTLHASDHNLTFTTRFDETDMSQTSTAQLWRRLLHKPQHLDSQIHATEEDLRRTRSDIDQAERFAGLPFPQQPQLHDLRAQLAHVEQQLTRQPADPTPADRPDQHPPTNPKTGPTIGP
jgi:hypothetical protein